MLLSAVLFDLLMERQTNLDEVQSGYQSDSDSSFMLAIEQAVCTTTETESVQSSSMSEKSSSREQQQLNGDRPRYDSNQETNRLHTNRSPAAREGSASTIEASSFMANLRRASYEISHSEERGQNRPRDFMDPLSLAAEIILDSYQSTSSLSNNSQKQARSTDVFSENEKVPSASIPTRAGRRLDQHQASACALSLSVTNPTAAQAMETTRKRAHDFLEGMHGIAAPSHKEMLDTSKRIHAESTAPSSSADITTTDSAAQYSEHCVKLAAVRPVASVSVPENVNTPKSTDLETLSTAASGGNLTKFDTPDMKQSNEECINDHPQTRRPPFPLTTSKDEQSLSLFLCFVRRYYVEVFEATQEDLDSRMRCRKISMNQVGIRCKFCGNLPYHERNGRSQCFPSSVSRIYQSLAMMIRDHFGDCPFVPPGMKSQYAAMKENTSQSAVGAKGYWANSALELGLIDTPDGIRFGRVPNEHASTTTNQK